MIKIDLFEPMAGITDLPDSSGVNLKNLEKVFKQLWIDGQIDGKFRYEFEDLLSISVWLAQQYSLSITPHTLRIYLRELHDCGMIEIDPDPTLQPLV